MSCAVLSTVITAQTQITHRFAPKTPSGVPLQLLMDHSELSDRPWQRLRLATGQQVAQSAQDSNHRNLSSDLNLSILC